MPLTWSVVNTIELASLAYVPEELNDVVPTTPSWVNVSPDVRVMVNESGGRVNCQVPTTGPGAELVHPKRLHPARLIIMRNVMERARMAFRCLRFMT